MLPIRHVLEFIKAEPENKTAERALDNVYQNTSVRPILCIVDLGFTVNDPTNHTAAYAAINSVSSPLYSQTQIDYDNGVLNAGDFAQRLVFMVPSEWYYQVMDACFSTNTVAVISWWEVTL